MNAIMQSLSGQNMSLRASLGDGDIALNILLGGGTDAQLQDQLNLMAGGGQAIFAHVKAQQLQSGRRGGNGGAGRGRPGGGSGRDRFDPLEG